MKTAPAHYDWQDAFARAKVQDSMYDLACRKAAGSGGGGGGGWGVWEGRGEEQPGNSVLSCLRDHVVIKQCAQLSL